MAAALTKKKFSWRDFLSEKIKTRPFQLLFFLTVIGTIFLFFRGGFAIGWGPSGNYENYSVQTTVNVTNAYPEIMDITCNDGSDIILNAGSTKTVLCNVEIRDYNGGNTINYLNSTFYYYQNSSADPDDNNTHYTNMSCSENSTDGFYTNWTCAFDVYYYAVNGSWIINSTVNDSFSATDTNNGTANISALLALNVTELIDFGDIAVTDTSGSVEANVTNLGNIAINVSVYGFGGNDEAAGAGLAMICEQRNISIHNERYDLSAATAYGSMTGLTGAAITIPGLKIDKQTVPNDYKINSTYWRLHINVSDNPHGICNGTVVFAAENT